MARRVLGAFAVTATATLASLALATPASAHTPVSSADCVKDKAVLKVKLTQYAGGNRNTVLIKDGDKVLADEKFGQSWEKKFEADGTVAHTFTITVKASDGDRFNYEKTHKTPECVKTPPTKPSEPTKPQEPKPSTPSEAPSSSETPPPSSSTPNAPAPGGSTPEPPLAATGASPMWLLFSGLGLVGAGAGTLLFLRRRRSA
ncbi:LPXTG-motif cell wall-anchored protein [Lentzea atacamensis]|uniref:LPXTG-motif cell wall-anchored protein n=1 Tax=Lentzea atacamensis TaxID=531938 RepID=A0A316HUV3_9PSEU|nr:LPXTG cell wall anchor domain-containing protein [Lentzea atacamensis]PWK85202.1 LPXTG-motif cell wall-anchored protein [Lentzea atacamensis]RAS66198.1 LPXTG-motif cell wall-anchored protein [Lentzea atacamensis]